MPFYRIVSLEGKIISCQNTMQTLAAKEYMLFFNPYKEHLFFALVKATNEKEAKNMVKLLSKTC